MARAEMFRPIRRRPAPPEAAAAPPAASGDSIESGPGRGSRVGTHPVTNTSPPGPPPASAGDAREQAWLAMLELVVAETGWPDA
jgi:hypothetical protein